MYSHTWRSTWFVKRFSHQTTNFGNIHLLYRGFSRLNESSYAGSHTFFSPYRYFHLSSHFVRFSSLLPILSFVLLSTNTLSYLRAITPLTTHLLHTHPQAHQNGNRNTRTILPPRTTAIPHATKVTRIQTNTYAKKTSKTCRGRSISVTTTLATQIHNK